MRQDEAEGFAVAVEHEPVLVNRQLNVGRAWVALWKLGAGLHQALEERAQPRATDSQQGRQARGESLAAHIELDGLGRRPHPQRQHRLQGDVVRAHPCAVAQLVDGAVHWVGEEQSLQRGAQAARDARELGLLVEFLAHFLDEVVAFDVVERQDPAFVGGDEDLHTDG